MQRLMATLIMALCILAPTMLQAGEVEDLLAKADALYAQETYASVTEALGLYEKAMELAPYNYDAIWKCARANGMAGELAKQDRVDGWKKICATNGKRGMDLAVKAQELNPQRPEGFFLEAWNVGIYSDGISVIKAVKEGLKKRAEHGFETTYALDKHWNEGCVIFGAGHYWQVLPWPLKDKKAALKYFEEYESYGYMETSGKKDIAKMYYADLLMELKGKEYQDKARVLCEDLVKNAEAKAFREQAQAYLDRLN